MRNRILHLGFWAGFGRMMAGGLALYFVAYLFVDEGAVTPFTIMTALAFWTVFSVIVGFDGYDSTRRLWNESIEPRINPNKDTAE